MRLIFYFAVTCLLFSCTAKNSVPKNVIPIKDMRSIVWDLMQADEFAMQNKQSDSTLNLKNESFRLYDQVFAIHKINRQMFYSSYKFYQEHPDLYKSLMDSVKKFSQENKVKGKDSLR